MSWHASAFFSSLALWTVAVLFVSPETQESRAAWRRGGVSAHDHLLLGWRNVTVALLCAAIMSLGYCKLRLYLDEMSDALAAGRTGLNPYNVNDGRFVFGNDKVTMTRSVLNCHDRATEFLALYSNDIAEMEENMRANFRLLIEDITNWQSELSMVTRELRSVSTSGQSAVRPPSDVPGIPDQGAAGGGGTNSSGTNTPQQGLGPLKGPDTRSMLVTKNRRQNRHTGGSSSGGATERPSRPPKLLGAQADRDTEEVEVWPPTTRGSAARTNAMALSRNARHGDPIRENTILNVRRRLNSSRTSDYSPPERHGFDDPRPQAENVPIELEERGGVGALPSKMQQWQQEDATPTATPPLKASEEGNQLVPWTGGDDLDADIAPSPKEDDSSDYRAASLQRLPQRNEHHQQQQRKEHTEPKPGDEENTGDRL
ncbi:uncharacterized protein LOC142572245 [Dermacentor variabilis]|uniref:uncharacterized protein LOC142572245 n=1 Tax=Dermacentor variabilis TaxID=34621 RepID=UPI003F5B4B59